SNQTSATVAVAPIVTAISPSIGPTNGGTTVTITGADFTGTTAVRFGSVAATSFTVISSTQITAVAPAEAASTVAVHVTNNGGTSALSVADQFQYVAALPAITKLSKTQGPTSGGTALTIYGSHFTGATAVYFGSIRAASFTVLSDGTISVKTHAEAA